MRLLVATSLRRGEALTLRWSASTSPTASCGSVGRSHGSTGTWSSVSPRRNAHAATCPYPPRWRRCCGRSRPAKRASGSRRPRSGLRRASSSPPRADGSRPQENRGQGLGHERCRPAQVEARQWHARGRVPLHAVSELLGHSCVAVTGDVYGHPPRRVCALPSSGSQEQWAGENVCRCYTNGYMAAKRPPRILSETASDLLFSVGMTGFEPAAP